MQNLLRTVARLRTVMQPYGWSLPIAALLGVVMTVSESLGITLFLPLLQHIAGVRNGNTVFIPYLSPLLTRLGISATDQPQYLVWAILLATVFRIALAYANASFLSWVNLSVQHRLSCRLYDELMSVDQRYLDTQGAGRFVNAFGTESWRASDAVSSLLSLFTTACTIIVFSTVLVLVSWRLTLLLCLCFLVITAIVHLVTWRTRTFGSAVVQASQRVADMVVDLVSGTPTIQALGLRDRWRDRFVGRSAELRRRAQELHQVQRLSEPIAETLYVAAFSAILLSLVGRGAATPPLMLVFLMVLVRLQPQVKQFLAVRGLLLGNLGAIDDVAGLLSPAGKSYIRSGRRACGPLTEGIALERVTFRYDAGARPALNDVSAEIRKVELVAVVGPSGAGKSTLVSLLLRLYDVSAGEIRVDGIPVPQLDLISWRRRVAVVPQDTFVFNGTVRQNIALGNLDASEAEIVTAARRAHADEFIRELPGGYDAKLGESGVGLSGGQRQRIALARAFVRDADLIVLDEATSWLDAVAEAAIQEAIDAMKGAKTLIVITHRLHTIRNADRVIVLENGAVVEQGRPGELLANGNLFARLATLTDVRA